MGVCDTGRVSESTDPAEPAGAPDSTGDVPESALPPKRISLLVVLATSIVVFDLITKIIAVALLTPGESVPILGGVVNFYIIRNPGAAFGMADSMTWLLSLIVIAVIVAIIRMAKRLRSSSWAVSLGLILGGAIGNLIDRIFRSPGFLRGHVVDFVSLFEPRGEHFAIFNVADSAITIGGVLLVITALRGIEVDGSRIPGRSARKTAEGSAALTEPVGADHDVAAETADGTDADRIDADRIEAERADDGGTLDGRKADGPIGSGPENGEQRG